MKVLIQMLFSLSLIGMAGNLVIGYAWRADATFLPLHLVIGLGSTFTGVLAAMMSMSYFLGTRDRLIEEGRLERLAPDVLSAARQVKKQLFGSCGPAMILLMLNATLAGCVYARLLPSLPHHVLAYLAIMSHARAFRATLGFHRFRGKLLEA